MLSKLGMAYLLTMGTGVIYYILLFLGLTQPWGVFDYTFAICTGLLLSIVGYNTIRYGKNKEFKDYLIKHTFASGVLIGLSISALVSLPNAVLNRTQIGYTSAFDYSLSMGGFVLIIICSGLLYQVWLPRLWAEMGNQKKKEVDKTD